MFFNTDILYRNGPLALVWLAGNGDDIMKSGPTRSKYRTDIMGTDLNRIIELILEQLPALGSNNGMSLKKIVCLFHGVVVIHHMQLDASLKRLSKFYLDTCQMRDLVEEINNVAPASKINMNPKTSRNRNLLNNSSTTDYQLNLVPNSPRALPQPMESESLGFGDLVDDVAEFEEMLAAAAEARFVDRASKRKENDANANLGSPAKIPRQLETIREQIDISRTDNDNFGDWNLNQDESQYGIPAPREARVEVENAPVETNNLNDNVIPENAELQLDMMNVDESPEHRPTTNDQNLLPLRPIDKGDLPAKQRAKSRRALFNKDIELSAVVVSRQAKAALGIDGLAPSFLELQQKVSSLHAPTKKEYGRNLKGLNFIENAGRCVTGALLNFQQDNLSNLKNSRREVSNLSMEEIRAGEDSRHDSRNIAAAVSGISVDVPRDNEPENMPPSPPRMPLGPIEPEMMVTVAGEDCSIAGNLPNVDGEVHLSPMDQVEDFFNPVFFPPAESVTNANVCDDTIIDENLILGALKAGPTTFAAIFPPQKVSKLQAAQGLMLLLRLQGEKKVTMKQSHSKKNYNYGPIAVSLYRAGRV